jgi:hypothetical protein
MYTMASACTGNENSHILVRLGKIDFAISKKKVGSDYLSNRYTQKSNVRSVKWLHNGPCTQRKSINNNGLQLQSIVHSPLRLCTMVPWWRE